MYKRRHSVEIVLIALLKIRQVRGLVLLALDHSRLVPFSSILAVNHFRDASGLAPLVQKIRSCPGTLALPNSCNESQRQETGAGDNKRQAGS